MLKGAHYNGVQVINSAYFSPNTGTKILTTCQVCTSTLSYTCIYAFEVALRHGSLGE